MWFDIWLQRAAGLVTLPLRLTPGPGGIVFRQSTWPVGDGDLGLGIGSFYSLGISNFP